MGISYLQIDFNATSTKKANNLEHQLSTIALPSRFSPSACRLDVLIFILWLSWRKKISAVSGRESDLQPGLLLPSPGSDSVKKPRFPKRESCKPGSISQKGFLQAGTRLACAP